MANVSLKFLDRDVEAQQDVATVALEQANKLDARIDVNAQQIAFTPEEVRGFRDAFIKISNTLVSNATTTATSGITFANYISKSST